jgi:hypothetical protein
VNSMIETEAEVQKFEIGQTVQWTIRPRGVEKVKLCVIEDVIQAEYVPDREKYPGFFKKHGTVKSRYALSYVVRELQPDHKGKPVYHWPKEKDLSAENGTVALGMVNAVSEPEPEAQEAVEEPPTNRIHLNGDGHDLSAFIKRLAREFTHEVHKFWKKAHPDLPEQDRASALESFLEEVEEATPVEAVPTPIDLTDVREAQLATQAETIKKLLAANRQLESEVATLNAAQLYAKKQEKQEKPTKAKPNDTDLRPVIRFVMNAIYSATVEIDHTVTDGQVESMLKRWLEE